MLRRGPSERLPGGEGVFAACVVSFEPGVLPEPEIGIVNVNADDFSATFSSCKRLRISRRFSFSTDVPYDLASSSVTFSSSCAVC